jgi:plastocyanin
MYNERMSNPQKILWAAVIVIIIVGAYWWWSSSQNPLPATAANPFPVGTPTSQISPSQSNSANNSAAAPTAVTVTFDGSSFSPQNVTIAQGGTRTWRSTAGPIWIASDPHPIHNGYDGTTMQQHCAAGYAGTAPFDECSQGTSFSFTFNKIGTWGYHDHLDHGILGTVTVVAQ